MSMRDSLNDFLDGDNTGPRKVVRPLLEKDIEGPSKAYARRKGDYVRKFKSPANPSVPDDIFVTNGRTWFVEFKAPGKKPTEKQAKDHDEIRAAGGEVYVFDDVEAFKRKRDEIAARAPSR